MIGDSPVFRIICCPTSLPLLFRVLTPICCWHIILPTITKNITILQWLQTAGWIFCDYWASINIIWKREIPIWDKVAVLSLILKISLLRIHWPSNQSTSADINIIIINAFRFIIHWHMEAFIIFWPLNIGGLRLRLL